MKWNGTNYTFNNEDVDNSNIYVIGGKIGVFTDADQQHVYDGTVYGLHNEILMIQYVPGTNGEAGKYYSYWAAEVDGSANSLEKVTVAQVNKVVDNIHENQDKLNNADIKEVKINPDTNQNLATITMVRNGTDKDGHNIPVDGAAITIENGGGTGGSGSENDTWISVGNGTGSDVQFNTGSKVEAITDTTTQDMTGIKINNTEYRLKAGTTYTAGNGIAIDSTNNNTISVKLKDGENNLAVDNDGLFLNKDLTGISSIAGTGTTSAAKIKFDGAKVTFNDKVTIDNTGKISGVAAGQELTDAVNLGQLKEVKEKVDKGWKLNTKGGTATDVKPEETVEFGGDDNITVSHTDKNVSVTLNKALKGLTSVTTNNAYVINVDEENDNSVTNVKYVNDQIAGAALGAGDGISIKDKKINVKLKDHEKNLVVNQDGLSLNTTLNGMEAIRGVGGGNISFAKDSSNVTINNITFNSDGRIQNVAKGTDDTDAVNVSQLESYVTANDTHIKAGDYEVKKVTDSNGKMISQDVSMDIVNGSGETTGTVTIKDVAKASDVGDVFKIADNIKNSNGTKTTVVDAVNNLNKNVGNLQYKNVVGTDIGNSDDTTTAIGKLNNKLSDVETKAGAHSTVSNTDKNITVTTSTNKKTGGTNYNVDLADDVTVKSSVAVGDTKMTTDGVTVGTDVSLKKDGLTAGDTKVTNSGLAIGEKTYVSKDGLNANSQKVTNVAAGEVSANSTDAVNGSQLYATNQAVINNAENISTLNRSLSNLDNRVNKVGAGAAALAALHPLDFDPDAKWDFAAGYGNYRGANAAAVGAYYRPNEDTMFSVGGTFGNGENMVNAGVSFKLGSGSSHVSTSRVAMAKEIKELRGELEAMKSAMLDANAGKKIDTSKLQLFPDVPQNHWAYEYVAQLAGNGMIEGYPDGNFAGDRPMTRYEFAAILYRAMTKGAVLSDKILSEFSHELEYFTVDTIAKDKAGNPTIQRVRTVKENKNK